MPFNNLPVHIHSFIKTNIRGITAEYINRAYDRNFKKTTRNDAETISRSEMCMYNVYIVNTTNFNNFIYRKYIFPFGIKYGV